MSGDRHEDTYSTSEVKALTGATSRQLDWWAWTGLMTPGSLPRRRRRYTFSDLLKVRMVIQLRQRGYSLPFLRRVVERLRGYPESSLRQVQLVEVDGELYICRDQEEVQRATDGQLAWSVMALGEAAKGARRKGVGVVVLKGKHTKPGSRGA
ncbi:MAG: MerR family transcriptional regulator [Dehalococcoidia bacterium]